MTTKALKMNRYTTQREDIYLATSSLNFLAAMYFSSGYQLSLSVAGCLAVMLLVFNPNNNLIKILMCVSSLLSIFVLFKHFNQSDLAQLILLCYYAATTIFTKD